MEIAAGEEVRSGGERVGVGQQHRLVVGTGVRFGYHPPWDTGPLKDLGDYELVREEYGIIKRIAKGRTTMPEFVSFPLAEPSDWKALRDRLDPDTPGRFPADWQARVTQIRRAPPSHPGVYAGRARVRSKTVGELDQQRFRLVYRTITHVDHPDGEALRRARVALLDRLQLAACHIQRRVGRLAKPPNVPRAIQLLTS